MADNIDNSVLEALRENRGIGNLLNPESSIPTFLYGIQLYYFDNGFPMPIDGRVDGLCLPELIERAKDKNLEVIGSLFKPHEYPDRDGLIVYIGYDVSVGHHVSPGHGGLTYRLPNVLIEKILYKREGLIKTLRAIEIITRGNEESFQRMVSLYIFSHVGKEV